MARLIDKQQLIRRRLLNHLRVDVVPSCPLLGITVVGVDDIPGRPGLLAGALAGEIVEGEGEGDGGEGEVEGGLSYTVLMSVDSPTEVKLYCRVPVWEGAWDSTYAKGLVLGVVGVSALGLEAAGFRALGLEPTGLLLGDVWT